MGRSSRILFASSVVVVLVVLGAVIVRGRAISQPPTKVIIVSAVNKAGGPASGFSVQNIDGAVDDCSSASPTSMGQDIVYCSPSAAGADVCWVKPDRITLLCGTDPWQKVLRQISDSISVPQTFAAAHPQPWGIELNDATKCRLRNGGSWGGRSDGLVGAYSCDREHEFILVPHSPGANVIDKSSPAWTVQIGDLGQPQASFPRPTKVRIATAYFAGSP